MKIEESINLEVKKYIDEYNKLANEKLNWFEKNILGINKNLSKKNEEICKYLITTGFFIGEKYACDKILQDTRK
jgi:hypothetical protein